MIGNGIRQLPYFPLYSLFCFSAYLARTMSIKPIPYTQLNWQDSTPYSDEFADIYYSPQNGMAESHYVFLQHNNLEQRFAELSEPHFIVAETGFGTGLNFLNTWKLWRENAPQGKKLYFISTELYPLKPDDLAQSLEQWQELKTLSAELCRLYPPNLEGLHCIEFSDGVTLLLYLGDVLDGLSCLLESSHPNLAYAPSRAVDAWFLDGFNPQQNQGMWQERVFQLMARLSKKGSTLATFTAAGFVRRGLQAAGFELKKVKGFAHKREMLTGEYLSLPQLTVDIQAHKRHSSYGHFWPIYRTDKPIQSVLVIGAGISGCTTAWMLAQAGLTVTLLDKDANVMQQASGNPQAVLFPKLSIDNSLFAQFNLFSLLYAQRFYQQAEFTQAFHQDGVLQLDNKTSQKLKQLDFEQLQQVLNTEQAQAISGTQLEEEALFYPQSGWIDTQKLADIFTQQQNFSFIGGQEIQSIAYHNHQWQAHSAQQRFTADAVVLCNAHAANQLLDSPLPSKAIRGQITAFSANNLSQLNTVVCKEGYICPPMNNAYICGASFDLHNTSADFSLASQQENIRKVQQFLPEFAQTDLELKFDRVNFRCTSPDYLPITGPVPYRQAFDKDYAFYSDNAKAMIPTLGNYHKGLFINIGMGSRGFSSAPIAAAIIRSYLLEQAYPLPFALVSALNPARFAIRSITGAYNY